MTIEEVTLDMAGHDFPSLDEIHAMRGAERRSWTDTGISAVALLLAASPDKVRKRLAKTVGIKDWAAADEADLGEALRVLRRWLNAPDSYAPPAPKPRVKRPEGIAQLPVPRMLKPAHADIACGLCSDPVKAGDLIGRFRTPKDARTYAAMDWLCHHCLYERRHTPRRRDLLMRIFHHLFAGSAVDLNAFECAVLLVWLTEHPGFADSAPWLKDPLDTTLTRLQTSITEGKAHTGIAFPTAVTVIAVLREAPVQAGTPAERDLLDAIAQHLEEWQHNPQQIEARKYGSGIPYRRQVLKSTSHPTALSARGGPFDLHTAPAPTDPQASDESDS
ncbi:hypothetical protein [Streptomyces sp. NPDC058773]|uniref:hypothetical protein n=1 Tax=Streptomyces sp. NPDC058773 TaxID=3346632 RepID=UPI0036B2198B